MRIKVTAFLCLVLILVGCGNRNTALNKALALRNKMLSSEACSFRAVISADYGEKLYEFAMDCKTDNAGNITFAVVEPVTLAGIGGSINSDGGAITFDDKVLAFQTMADGQVTPVSAPWLLIKTLRSGYLKGCAEENDGYLISIDDSYEGDALHLNVFIQDNLPKNCEIFYQGRRILTVMVEEFTYL